MPREPSSRIRGRTWVILFLLSAAAIWAGLQYTEPRSEWLRVEASPRVVEGQFMTLRVQLAPQPEPGVLYADLHWGTSRDQPMQYLATGGPKAVGKEGGTFDYKIMVPHREGLRFVMGVIFWCREGGWSAHKLAASTKLIPVVTDKAPAPDTRLEPLGLQPPSDVPADHPRPAAFPRWLTGLLFLLAMVAAWRAGRSENAPDEASERQTRFWQALVVIFALACLWEVFGLEHWLGTRARAIARAGDFYYPRVAFQRIVVSAAVAATVLLLALVWRVRRSRRLLLVSLALYAAISLVNLVSLHAIDRVADFSWHGVTVVQSLKLVCAALICDSICKASPRRPG